MYYHSQNIKKEDKENGIIHWRCWLGEQPQITLFIKAPTTSFGIDFDLCRNGWQEETIGFSFKCLLFAVWVGLEWRWLYRVLEKITRRKGERFTNGRTFGVNIHNWTLWLDIWRDPMESRGSDYWWQHISFDIREFFRGKGKREEELLEEREVLVLMPEGTYKGKATLSRITFSYPRWFKNSFKSFSIDVAGGIPFEGKGENSWDCGADACYGFSGSAESIPEGVGKLVGSVLKSRVRYGGWGDWVWDKKKSN